MQRQISGKIMIFGACCLVMGVCAWMISRRRNRAYGQLERDVNRNSHCLIRMKGSLKFGEMNRQEYRKVKPETIQDLFFNQKNNPSIFLEIQNNNFINLERLSVSYNQIVSVQPLTRINMPYLYYLQLQNNLIHQIKSLRKICSKRVCLLQINNNPITDSFRSLCEMPLEFTEYLWVEQFMTDFLAEENISYLLKVETSYMKRVFLGSGERMRLNGVIVERLHKRFQDGFEIRGIQP